MKLTKAKLTEVRAGNGLSDEANTLLAANMPNITTTDELCGEEAINKLITLKTTFSRPVSVKGKELKYGA